MGRTSRMTIAVGDWGPSVGGTTDDARRGKPRARRSCRVRPERRRPARDVLLRDIPRRCELGRPGVNFAGQLHERGERPVGFNGVGGSLVRTCRS